MQLKLYKVVVAGRDPVFLLARTSHDAAVTFVAIEIDAGKPNPNFTVERVDEKVLADQRFGPDELLECGPAGQVGYDPLVGWCATPSG